MSYEQSGMGGWQRTGWVDGLPTLRQPAIALQMFTIILSAYAFLMEQNNHG